MKILKKLGTSAVLPVVLAITVALGPLVQFAAAYDGCNYECETCELTLTQIVDRRHKSCILHFDGDNAAVLANGRSVNFSQWPKLMVKTNMQEGEALLSFRVHVYGIEADSDMLRFSLHTTKPSCAGECIGDGGFMADDGHAVSYDYPLFVGDGSSISLSLYNTNGTVPSPAYVVMEILTYVPSRDPVPTIPTAPPDAEEGSVKKTATSTHTTTWCAEPERRPVMRPNSAIPTPTPSPCETKETNLEPHDFPVGNYGW